MSKYQYSGAVEVEIQGPRVLELVERQRSYAHYHVIGFNKTVSIIDYRKESLEALDAAISGEDSAGFAYVFSSKAMATVTTFSNDLMTIELCDADEPSAQDILFIAVGLEDRLPAMDFTVRKIEKLDDGRFGFIGLACKKPADQVVEAPSVAEPSFSSDSVAVPAF